jgi:hypothetical protein
MTVQMDPTSIGERRDLVALQTDLSPALRRHAKVDDFVEGISRRLQQVADLRRLCLVLAEAKPKDRERPSISHRAESLVRQSACVSLAV